PVALTLGAWTVGLALPQVLVRFGIHDYGTRFLDAHAVLAALDFMRVGGDPIAGNPLDPLQRPHVYSDWWLGLRFLGVGRAQGDWVGAIGLLALLVTAIVTMRPRRRGEALWLGFLLVSPVVVLVVTRANNDLVIFVLLAAVAMGAAAGGWRQWAAVAGLAVATGLKYYPVVAALPFLWARPLRRMPGVASVAAVAALCSLALVWSQLDRARFLIGSGIHTMGAPLLWRDLGWTDGQSALPGMGLLFLLGCGFAGARITTGLAVAGDVRDRLLAAMGAAVILACFVAGMNYAYRWIFALWPAFWLWRQAGDDSLPRGKRRIAALGCGLMGLAFWQDGIFCVAINALPPRSAAWVDQAQLIYRLWTQPLQWLLMGLLAGWLLEGVAAIAGEWGRRRKET
ncbi:MAG TPA: hypothetical protein VHN79_11290, partial [Lacunisphaera sp.]|nr:hypothetical protein [Lacunisphaera sp.]